MKTLYFDIDGTILRAGTLRVKAVLAHGGFECAVRAAGFEALVCVGDLGLAVHLATSLDPSYDGLGVLFAMCDGAFADEVWFRSMTTFTPQPDHRVRHLDLTEDWWYVDDLAAKYCALEDQRLLFETWQGRRVLVPVADGDGGDIVAWLAQTTDSRRRVA